MCLCVCALLMLLTERAPLTFMHSDMGFCVRLNVYLRHDDQCLVAFSHVHIHICIMWSVRCWLFSAAAITLAVYRVHAT